MKKRAIDYLYCSSSTINANTLPQGNFNIEKALANENPWESPFTNIPPKKKILIFATWMKVNDRVKKLISGLLDEGFTICREDKHGNFSNISSRLLSNDSDDVSLGRFPALEEMNCSASNINGDMLKAITKEAPN